MKRLVLLGGGYGGFEIINRLIKGRLPHDLEILLIDRLPHHTFKTEYYALAAGTVSDKALRLDFPEHPSLKKLYGEIGGIDLNNKKITVRDHEQIEYDYLVVGLGSVDNYHGIKGASRYTDSVQSMKKARKTYEKLVTLDAYQTVTIVGAGLTGVELAAELRESRPDLSIRLLDRNDKILKQFPDKLSRHVSEWLKDHDIDVIHGSNVDYVEKDTVCNNSVCLPTDATVWTAGIKPNEIVRALDVEKDTYGRVVLNRFHQLPNDDSVYVVGDNASLPLAPSAQLAKQQGRQIADVLLDKLVDKEPKMPGEIKLKGTIGSLGKHDGFGRTMNLSLTGKTARLMKSGVLWIHKFNK